MYDGAIIDLVISVFLWHLNSLSHLTLQLLNKYLEVLLGDIPFCPLCLLVVKWSLLWNFQYRASYYKTHLGLTCDPRSYECSKSPLFPDFKQ